MTEFSGGLDGPGTSRHRGVGVPTFDELMRQAARAAGGQRRAPDAWRHLAAASALLVDELPLETLLQRTLELAVELVGATSGVLESVHTDATEQPVVVTTNGHGAAQGTPPAGGPDLRMPVRAGSKVVGSLLLGSPADGTPFDEEDEELVAALLSIAGVSLENAALREERARRERSLLETTALLPGRPDVDVPQFVADRVRTLAGADVAWVVTGPEPGGLELRALSGFTPGATVDGIDFSHSLERCAVVSRRPLRARDLSSHPRAVDIAEATGSPPIADAVLVPLVGGEVDGVVAVGWHRHHVPGDVRHDDRLPPLLAQQVALTLLAARGEPSVGVVPDDRDRVARDLHDLVIQRLFAMGLELKTTGSLQDPHEITVRLDRTVDQLDMAIRDIRRAIFDLESVAEMPDPVAAITEVVDRAGSTMGTSIDLRLDDQVSSLADADLVADVVAVLTEALSNCVRHAAASSCTVDVTIDDGLVVAIRDDGVGMPDAPIESGLANLRARAERRGGSFTVVTSPGRGTLVVWMVPLLGHGTGPAERS